MEEWKTAWRLVCKSLTGRKMISNGLGGFPVDAGDSAKFFNAGMTDLLNGTEIPEKDTLTLLAYTRDDI
jgi:hypothetical protein